MSTRYGITSWKPNDDGARSAEGLNAVVLHGFVGVWDVEWLAGFGMFVRADGFLYERGLMGEIGGLLEGMKVTDILSQFIEAA